jgi:inorganic pyrophosphatase
MMADANEHDFWQGLDALVAESRVVVDRPRGTAHPRFPEMIYPLDYGYLEGTRSPDGGGIDVWIGSLPEQRVIAIVVMVDLRKHDAEIKLLLGCAPDEQRTILALRQSSTQSALLITRPDTPSEGNPVRA